MAVCIGQHPTSNIGRSSLAQVEPPIDNYFLPTNRALMNWGLCVTQQWSRALQVDPPFIFLTGWNEWIAQRFIQAAGSGAATFCGRTLQVGDTYFVDLFSQEYNRDIEPMRGGYGDNYYYQMVAYLRRFKGARPLPASSGPKTILLNSPFSQWSDVAPEYLDDPGDTAARNFAGFGTGLTYTNTTGRNDIDAAKVARDYTQLYFYARTVATLTSPLTSTNWMVLLLNTDGNPTNGWAGYDYMVNRVVTTGVNGLRGRVERSLGGWNWQTVGEASLVAQGNQLHLAVARSLLDLPATNGLMTLDFKWADNLSSSGDPMEFMDRGDVAPNNRFNYRYRGTDGCAGQLSARARADLKSNRARHHDLAGDQLRHRSGPAAADPDLQPAERADQRHPQLGQRPDHLDPVDLPVPRHHPNPGAGGG